MRSVFTYQDSGNDFISEWVAWISRRVFIRDQFCLNRPFGDQNINVKGFLLRCRKKVLFDYYDRPTQRTRTVEFRSKKLFSDEWHTVIFSVTGNAVSMRTDCGKSRVKPMKRVFPAFLSTRGTHFYLANLGSGGAIFTVRLVYPEIGNGNFKGALWTFEQQLV